MHVGSSIITKRFERYNASTGQIATQAAQPKQRPSSSERISCASWHWLVEVVALLKPTPTPSFPLEGLGFEKEAI